MLGCSTAWLLPAACWVREGAGAQRREAARLPDSADTNDSLTRLVRVLPVIEPPLLIPCLAEPGHRRGCCRISAADLYLQGNVGAG